MTHEPEIGNAAARSMPDERERGSRKWYLLGILVMINLLGTVDRGVISVIAEPLKAEFHLSDKQLGLLSGMAYSVTFALAVLPMGWLADRVNRRALLSTTVTIWSMLTAACALSSSFATMFLARMGAGAGEAPVVPASLSLIADTFPARLRNTAVSLFLAGGGIGVLLLFFIGAWLIEHFGWRAVFLVSGGPGLLMALLLFFTTREPVRGTFDVVERDGAVSIQGTTSTIQVLRNISQNSVLCFAISAMTIATGVFYSLITWTTSFLVRVHDMSIADAAIWMGLGFGLCVTVGSILAGPVADRFSKGDRRKLALVPAVTTFLGAASGVVLTMAYSLPAALLGLGMLGFMGGFYLGPGYALVLSLAAPSERGTTMAMAKLITTLVGGSMITFLTGVISDAVGGADSIRPALLSNAVMLLIATFCFAMIHRVLGQQSTARAAVAAA